MRAAAYSAPQARGKISEQLIKERQLLIAHVIPRDAVGGVEVAARSMLEVPGLACTFKLLFIAGPTLAPDRSHVCESPFRSALNPFAQLRAALKLYAMAPDILICSLWRSVPACILVKLVRPRTRLAYFLHLERPMHLVDAICARFAMWFSDVVLADSLATLSARRVPANKPTRIISFVLDRLSPTSTPSEPRPKFISWTRLSHQKGIDRSLHLIAALARRGRDVTFDIWGPDGGELDALRQLSRSLGLEDRVTFRGPVARSALGEVTAGLSFFLQLSRFEGMAMSTVEAMQLGLVPVTTAVGQMTDYVRPGETGIVVDPDRLDDAVEEIESLIDAPPRYRSLHANALQRWRDTPLYAEDICRAAIDSQREPGA